ncbi:MAG: LysM peptidoglycan-binding domain-containing protein [Candidatus Promineifilaceae bacterium]
MRVFRLIPFVLLTLIGLSILAFSEKGTAVAQGDNLLVNPSFEGQYNSYVPETPQEQADCPLGVCTTAQMPPGWKPWWVKERPTDVNPEYKPAEFSDRVRSGSRASQYFSFWSTHKAGLRQTVTVPTNATVTFSIWGFSWMTELDDATGSDSAATPNMRIGIDPTGGTNPYSPAVVWSGFQEPKDVYALFSVQAQAQGNQVTVFTFSAPDVNPASPDYGYKHTDIYWDDASLTASGGSSAPPPAPTSNPGGGATNNPPQGAPVSNSGVTPPTSTPDADGVIYSIVQSGDSLWSIAAKAGITLDEILELNGMEQGDFVRVGDRLIVGYADNQSPAPEAETENVEAAGGEATVEGEAESTATATPEATPTEVVEATKVEAEVEEALPEANICLLAFDDTNQDGVRDADEPLRSAVAFTISDVEKVVSNYVTDGASEPFCIEGLDPGNYQITRSIAAGEVVTTGKDQSLALQAGESKTLEFGSYQDGSAVAELQSSNTAADANNLSGSAVVTNEGDDGGIGTVFIVAVVIAVLLLLGVLVIILSARRSTV